MVVWQSPWLFFGPVSELDPNLTTAPLQSWPRIPHQSLTFSHSSSPRTSYFLFHEMPHPSWCHEAGVMELFLRSFE